MAVLQSLLQIVAKVTGTSAVTGLAGALGKVQGASAGVSKGLGGMAQAAGVNGLAGAFSRLMPLLSVGGIVAMTKGAIEAGDAFYDMSQRTGVSVEMLARFKRAAGLSGTSIEAVEKGLLRLSRNMAAAAASPRVGEMTAQDMDKAVQAVRDGERRQVESVERAADRRVEALQQESSRRMAELNRRYRNEQRRLDDSFDDQRNAAEQAIQDRADAEIKAIQRGYDEQRRIIQQNQGLSDAARQQQLNALQDAEDRAVNGVRDGAERQTKARGRALRDQQQQQQDALDDRKAREEAAIKASEKAQTDAVKAAAKLQTEAVKTAADAQEKLIKGVNTDAMSQQLEELGLSSKDAAKAFLDLGVRVTDAAGRLRNPADVMLDVGDALSKIPEPARRSEMAMKLMGRGGAELIPMLLMGSKAIRGMAVSMTTEFAAAADQYNDKLVGLSGQVSRLGIDLAVVLLPALIEITNAVIGVVRAFNNMPGPLKAITLAVIGLAIALPTIVATLANLIVIAKALAAVKLGAGLTAGLAGVGPALAGIKVAIAGLITWITTVALPGLIAFLASPLGIALLVVAVVGAIIIFRKQIGEFLTWWGGVLQSTLSALINMLKTIYVDPWVKLFEGVRLTTIGVLTAIGKAYREFTTFLATNVIQPAISLWNSFTGAVRNGMKSAADYVYGIWNNIVNAIRGAVNAVVSTIRNLLRPVANTVNRVIDGFNRVSGAVNGPTVGRIPALAEGGVVDRPTVALVGERGREYVVPESKAAAFATNYLQGRRGEAALNMGTPQINVTTGPVIQQDGTRYVSVEDLERAMRATADGVIGRLRSPAARMALGIR